MEILQLKNTPNIKNLMNTIAWIKKANKNNEFINMSVKIL